MPATEQQVKMAARLYEMRDTARRLLGDDYAATMGNLGTALQGVANATGRTPLSVAIEAAKSADGLKQCYFLAAAVELAEPSTQKPNHPISGA